MQFALRALAAHVHRAAVDVHSLGSSLLSFRSPMANDPRSPPARSPERGSLAWLSHHSHPRMVELGLKYHLPSATALRAFAEIGGLMAFVHKILRGKSPAETPV